MHCHTGSARHQPAPADPQVALPKPAAGMTPYAEYGDTSGALGDCQSGRGQALPAGLAAFIQKTQVYPDRIALTVHGDADVLRGHAAGGDDTVSGYASLEILVGDARLMLDASRGGADRLTASASNAAIFGDAELMHDRARGGDDVMVGSPGVGARAAAANALYGDAYAMSGCSRGGDDRITGGGSYPGSTNLIYGDAHTLSGHARAGDDTLVGGQFARNDMWGDAAVIEGRGVATGHDVFVVTPTSGINVIHDFEPGRDRIDLTAFAARGIHGFDDLQPYRIADGDGSGFLFSRSPGGPGGPPTESSLAVLGDEDLAARDFIFA